MAVDFSQFSPKTTAQSTDYLVGYDLNASGGEKKFTISTIANAVSGIVNLNRLSDASGVNGILQSDGAGNFFAASVPNRNKLINAQGLINQRVYVSGTATTGANQYTVDRWRVVTSGQNLTFVTANNITTFTAPAGGVEQVIEGLNVEPGTYVLSWTGTATATVDGTARANGSSFTLAGGANVTVKFSNGTFSLPQLERGTEPTPFEHRPIGTELSLCERYYEKSYNLNTAPGTAETVTSGFQGTIVMRLFGLSMNTTNGGFVNIPFKVKKRSNPAVTLYSAQGTVNAFTELNPLAERTSLVAASVGQFGFQPVYQGGSLVIHSPCFHYIADAEI